MKFSTASAAATRKLAAKLAREILKSRPHKKHARIIALVGDLGAGKTTFTQGFAKALGITHRMVSPTFLIFRSYEIAPKNNFKFQISNFKFLYHMDAYRIDDAKELKPLGFKEAIADPQNIFLIEWADKIKKALPKDTIWVELGHGRKETERTLTYRR